MKKMIICGLISILIGYVIGNILFTNIDFINLNNKNNKYYLLQEGTYSDNNILNNLESSIKTKIIEKNNNKISIYIGITKNLEVAERLINIYESKNIKLSIVEKYYSNDELENIEQFDNLILSAKDSEEILKIEEVVLASYEEIINNSNSI